MNGQNKLKMFTTIKDLQEKAVTRYVNEYRSKNKHAYLFQINEYSTVVNYKDEGQENQKISNYSTEKKSGLLASVKDWPAYIGYCTGAAAFVGAFFVGNWLFALTFIGI